MVLVKTHQTTSDKQKNSINEEKMNFRLVCSVTSTKIIIPVITFLFKFSDQNEYCIILLQTDTEVFFPSNNTFCLSEMYFTSFNECFYEKRV